MRGLHTGEDWGFLGCDAV